MMTEKIQSLGVDCWLDEKNLEGGDVIPDEIIRGIDACQEAIVLISPNSVNSKHRHCNRSLTRNSQTLPCRKRAPPLPQISQTSLSPLPLLFCFAIDFGQLLFFRGVV